MFKYFSLDGEEENFEATTVSGWVIEKLGEIPRSGTKFTHANLNVEVTKSTVKKVLQIKVMLENENTKE